MSPGLQLGADFLIDSGLAVHRRIALRVSQNAYGAGKPNIGNRHFFVPATRTAGSQLARLVLKGGACGCGLAGGPRLMAPAPLV